MAASDRRIETGESNRTIIIVVAVVAAIVIAAGFYFLMRLGSSGPSANAGLQGAVRAGSPQFDEYKSKIFLDDPEATEAKRALGDIVMSLQTTVRNLTGKTLTGLEMRAAVVDYEGKPVKERTVVVIPTRQPELAPNKVMPVQVLLDGMSETDARANIKMEVTGFKFKE
jgi:flagellar basal body-associated protein FliL